MSGFILYISFFDLLLNILDEDKINKHDFTMSSVKIVPINSAPNMSENQSPVSEVPVKFDWKEDIPFRTNLYNYWHWRIQISNLRSLVNISPGREASDGAVNTTALIAALLLTVPYSVLGNFNSEYFNWLEDQMETCDPENLIYKTIPGKSMASTVRQWLKNWSITTMIPSVFVIFTCMLYYISRPFEDRKFEHWWHRGKYIIGFQVFGNILSAYGVWFTLEISFHFFMMPDDEVCHSKNDGHFFMTAGNFLHILVSSSIV